MQQLDDFKANLPPKPYCTSDFRRDGLLIRPADIAINHHYIQHNQVNSKSLLVFDIDRPFYYEDLSDELQLPIPNFVVQNKSGFHAGWGHIAYSLATPIHLNDDSKRKPIRYAASIEAAFRKKMRADQGYAGLVMKNPLSSNWQTTWIHNNGFDLPELHDYVDLEAPVYFNAVKHEEDYGLGRNCNLFENLRRWSYKNLRHYTYESEFFEACLSQSEMLNGRGRGALPYSEVRSVAKSVSRWTFRNYEGGGSNNRGRDTLKGAMLNLKEKQTLSAVITNRERSAASESAIKIAVLRLQAKGDRISIRAVAKEAGVSKGTAEKYKHLFQ